MARPRVQHCHECGRHVSECGPLSSTKRCADCARRIAVENMDQLHAHHGPRFDHWRRRILAAFGVATPEPEVDDEAA